MKWVLRIRAGKRVREQIPFISDLLFVHDTAEALNPIVSKTPTLQYRYRKGGAYCEPVTVPDRDMQRFIHAIGTTESPRFYLPEEITPSMYGRRIRIVGGPLDGYEGSLITTRGSARQASACGTSTSAGSRGGGESGVCAGGGVNDIIKSKKLYPLLQLFVGYTFGIF